MSKNATPPKTNGKPDVLEEARTAIQEQNSLKRALSAAQTNAAKMEAKMSEARTALANASASRLMQNPDSDPNLPDTVPETIAYREALASMDAAKATVSGIQTRISNAD